MVNEFGNLQYTCSPSDLAPNGASFDLIENQVCAVPGAVPGQALVSGAAYVRDQYGFEVSNLWRNVGINAAFFVFFALCTRWVISQKCHEERSWLLVLDLLTRLPSIGMENYKLPVGRLATIFYKAEPKDVMSKMNGNSADSEKGSSSDDYVPPTSTGPAIGPQSREVSSHTGRTLVWKNISLDLKLNGEEKCLLDDLSGRCFRHEIFKHLLICC